MGSVVTQYTTFIVVSFLIFAAAAFAGEDVDDLVDVFESDGRIIAVIKGTRTVPFDLRLRESVAWSGSSGHLGAFLTTENFYAISAGSGAWQALSLRSEEHHQARVSLSPFLALLTTRERAVGFTSVSGRFVTVSLPIRDRLVAAEAEEHIAVVITSSKALGLSAKASAFSEIRFRLREIVEDVKLTSKKVTVRTSDRLLSFSVFSPAWRELRL